MGIKPLKKFGQNYLIDKNIVNKMINGLELAADDEVIEIGPGRGFITSELIKKLKSLTGVEIDTRVINELEEKFPNLTIIQHDFVKLNLKEIDRVPPFKIIGNIPFNQTGNILFKLISDKDIVSEAVLIIPYDIAKRIVAKQKTKEYGILTVLFNYFSSTKIISRISPNVFLPKPKIEAAIIRIKFDKQENIKIDKNLFIKVVKASFGNRRKTLNNSLSNSIFSNCDFSQLELPLTKRAEELTVDHFLKLTEHIQTQTCRKKTK